MDFSTFSTDPSQLAAFVEGLGVDAWKKMSGEASAISICSLSSPNVLLLKGQDLVRLAYPLRDTFARNGKARGTFAISVKTATAILKMESAIKDRLGSSGVMKKTELKATFQSIVSAPTSKYPSHTVTFDFRIEQPKTAFYAMTESEGGAGSGSGWSTIPIDYDSIAKFSLMSLRIVPTMIWKGNGKSAVKWLIKQGVVAFEEDMPPPVDEANIDVTWDALEDDTFLSELAGASSNFTAEKLVPKGLKAAKGAKVAQQEEVDEDKPSPAEFKPIKSTKAAPIKRKKPVAVAPVGDDEDDEDEEVVSFGSMETPKEKPKQQKRPRQTKKIDPSEIPLGKIEMGDDVIDMEETSSLEG